MSPTASTPTMAVIDRSTCNGCGMCGEICPRNAIQITYVGYVDPERCTGCGQCVKICPLQAIRLSQKTVPPRNKNGDATECFGG